MHFIAIRTALLGPKSGPFSLFAICETVSPVHAVAVLGIAMNFP